MENEPLECERVVDIAEARAPEKPEKPEKEVTDRQRAVIAALVGGLRKREAAERTGVPERTLRDWLRRPHFQAELRRVRAAVWEEMMADVREERRRRRAEWEG